MRLVDADALKEDFKTRLAACNEWIEKAKDKETKIRASAVKSFIAEVIMTINNAPTVPLPDFKEGYKQAIIDGKTNYSRPQGKWIIDQEGDKNTITCPFCGERHCCKMNFCGNCGADMRGGAE